MPRGLVSGITDTQTRQRSSGDAELKLCKREKEAGEGERRKRDTFNNPIIICCRNICKMQRAPERRRPAKTAKFSSSKNANYFP